MADLFASRQPMRLNDGTADANNAVITNAAPGSTDYALVVRQVGIAAAAALADATANPTTTLVGVDNEIFNGTTWDRQRSVANAQDTTGTGIAAAGILGQLDDAATSTVTENQFAPVRISSRRAMLVEGVASGTALTVDTELPAAAALADNTANPTTSLVGGMGHLFDGTTWDRQRSTDASDGNTALTTTGIAAVGVGPGFARRFNPTNLATAANSTSAVDINGAATIGVQVNTTTTGTYTAEVTNDGTTWKAATGYNYATNANVSGQNLTPTVGDAFVFAIGGMRQFRLRTVTTLGATMAHVFTLDLSETTIFLPQFTSPAALADATANPTTAMASVALMGYNGATWDRLRSSTAAGLVVDTELPAAAALADATANPTVPTAGAALMGYNGTTWDRVRTANTGRLQVDVVTGGGSNASVLVDNAAFTDATSSVTAVGYYFDEVAGTALTENDIAAARIDSKRAQVLVIEDATTRGQRAAVSAGGALLVDTELPAAAALADATANPTVPTAGSALLGFNGTTWDRVRTANTGRLQVDVVTGGSSPPASEVPTGYNALIVYGTTSATASGATASVTTNTPANTKTFYVRSAMVSASGATKWQVKFGATVLATGFISSSKLGELVRFDPPLTGTGDGTTALTIDVTNREASAMDLYARMGAIVLQ